MFSWCFKCREVEGGDEYSQRPKTRNNPQDILKTTVAVQPDLNDQQPQEPPKTKEEIQNECLDAHNNYRTKHGVAPLVLNNDMNDFADKWAKHLAENNSLQHRKNNKYGENLYLGTGMGPNVHELAVQAWYDEIKNYNFKTPGFSSRTGHFTQVIWKASKRLGVGVATRGNRTWIVCNYDPPGNMLGIYLENVPPLLEHTVAKILDMMRMPKNVQGNKLQTVMKNIKKTKEEPQAESVDLREDIIDLNIYSKFELDCLDSHNKYRALHGSPPMKLDRKLCNLAQEWSKHLARRRSMLHRPNNQYGENLFYCINFDPSAEYCVKSWYDEINNYNFSIPGFTSQTGHFTQVVWKGSTDLGVGYTKLNNMTYVVCNYSPAGNVLNKFKEQVPRPGSKPTTSSLQPKADDLQSFEEVCLETHNNFRAMHESPPMTLNTNLSFFANDWAQVRSTKISYCISTKTTN